MLERLVRRFRSPPPPAHRLPAPWRVYAVGDIHGRADLLGRLYRLIRDDARRHPQARPLVVCLGDYLDRGPYVKETLDLLGAGAPRGLAQRCLLGNHEALFLRFLDDPGLLEPWLGLGGQATLLSYGVRPPPGDGFSARRAEEVRDALLAVLPPAHLTFLRRLEPYLRLGDYLFVHAGIRPQVALEDQTEEDLLWLRRGGQDPGPSPAGYRIVHGHTICRQPRPTRDRIGVDTGAYATGVLTCAVLQEGRVKFLSTGREGP
jgi:serine/threonine protein phosphatase 1